MAHVVAEPCVGCKYADCIVVCPVDCFRDGQQMLYIHPAECIDCSACVQECPVGAIFPEERLPDDWVPYRDLNATMARQCPRVHAKDRPPFSTSLGEVTDSPKQATRGTFGLGRPSRGAQVISDDEPLSKRV